MLGLFQDAALRLPVTGGSPKRFLFPLKGGSKTSSLYLGDPYSAKCLALAAVGADIVRVDQTNEFMNSGSAIVNGMAIAYIGKTENSLTGVTGIVSVVNPGDSVVPNVVYIANGNIRLIPSGPDLSAGVSISLKRADQSSYGFPGTPVIFAQTQIAPGVANAVRIDIQAVVVAGVQQEFVSWSVLANTFYVRDASSTAIPVAEEVGQLVYAPGYVFRRDQALSQRIRILPATREIRGTQPGFKVGEYRWRDENTMNAKSLLPSIWNADVDAIGIEKFIAGIGHAQDLAPLGIEEIDDSIHLKIQHGHYFTGPKAYYLPDGLQLEFIQAAALTHRLNATPTPQSPIFVGTWKLDSQGFYEKDLDYRYQATGFDVTASAPTHQFTLNRRTSLLTLNTLPAAQVLFLGTISGQATDYFDLTTYPIDSIVSVYVDRGPGNENLPCTKFNFDREQGTITITSPSGLGSSIAGALPGEPVFARCNAAIAVLYETGDDATVVLNAIDLNPAFSGLAGGHVYLQHRRQKPASLVLAADKPRIDIPPTHDSIIGLIAYGPVYFGGDYALLTATAFSRIANERIPNARMRVIVDPDSFSGSINYKDPTLETIEVITGGDGTANLIFIPKAGFGTWIPTTPASGLLAGTATTNVANDSLVLPEPIPISQIRNDREGWLVTTYKVLNIDPLFGKVGADPARGEIPFLTTGSPGTINYKTNGERRVWANGSAPVLPIAALDVNGKNYNQAGFTGSVHTLVFDQPLPTDNIIGAWFVTYLQRVTIRLQLEDSNAISNMILLQMSVPSLILENPWLFIQDSIQGILNQYRLGWLPAPI